MPPLTLGDLDVAHRVMGVCNAGGGGFIPGAREGGGINVEQAPHMRTPFHMLQHIGGCAGQSAPGSHFCMPIVVDRKND
jgi:hypothetical protein